MDTGLASWSVAPARHLEATAHHGTHRPCPWVILPKPGASHSCCLGPYPLHAGLDLPGFRAPVSGEQLWPPALQLGSTLPPLPRTPDLFR